MEAAGSIGEEAKRLRDEVDQFLAAVRDDTGDRRHCDRVQGNGTLRCWPRAAMRQRLS